jgi:uncharacterized protein (DUF885 family)
MQGPQQDVARFLMIAASGAAGASAFENMLARLEAVPVLLAQVRELMRRGLETGLTPPRITLRDVPAQILSQAPAAAGKPLLRAFDRFPESVPEAEQARLRREAARIYEAKAGPAFRELHEFFAAEYLPRTRETIALRDVPDGDAWYAFLVRQSTTTDLTPDEIHRIGLEEVARIRGLMEHVLEDSGFAGTFAEFVNFLAPTPASSSSGRTTCWRRTGTS